MVVMPAEEKNTVTVLRHTVAVVHGIQFLKFIEIEKYTYWERARRVA